MVFPNRNNHIVAHGKDMKYRGFPKTERPYGSSEVQKNRYSMRWRRNIHYQKRWAQVKTNKNEGNVRSSVCFSAKRLAVSHRCWMTEYRKVKSVKYWEERPTVRSLNPKRGVEGVGKWETRLGKWERRGIYWFYGLHGNLGQKEVNDNDWTRKAPAACVSGMWLWSHRHQGLCNLGDVTPLCLVKAPQPKESVHVTFLRGIIQEN